VTFTDNSKSLGTASRHDQIFDATKALGRLSGSFVDQQTVRGALSALQRGPIRFNRNSVIASDYVFLLVSGVVRSCKTFTNGSRSVLAFYLPGDLFGWSDQKQHFLSVEAATDATVLFFKRSALLSVAARESCVAAFVLDVTTRELRRAQEHALLMNVRAKFRVAKFLSDLGPRLGGATTIDLPMSHQDIADHLGLTIETLSRMISGLQRSGIVSRSGSRMLTVHNYRLLTQLCA
jgi:CRP/FNR family transcriptional regulator, nitrogen fixation regulation protein